MQREEQTGKKRAAVITYNSVRGYPAGTYNGKAWEVSVYSNANTKAWGARDAPGKLDEILKQAEGGLPDKVYLYAGLWAMEGALSAAEHLAKSGKELTLVACDCDAEYKAQAARNMGVPIIWSGCGGLATLGTIVDTLLAQAE